MSFIVLLMARSYSPVRLAAIEREVLPAEPVSTPSSQVETSAAHFRPSLIAQTIRDWPRLASPAAKMPSTEVP
jgi:hypothetical protein